MDDIYLKLWSVKALPNAKKNFVWCVLRGKVATKDNFRRKKIIQVDRSYPVCKNHVETINHLFFLMQKCKIGMG